jgi:hypothetical protein
LAIKPGETLDGFVALDTSLGKPNTIPFIVYSAAPTGQTLPSVEGIAERNTPPTHFDAGQKVSALSKLVDARACNLCSATFSLYGAVRRRSHR